jgi:hypothetical protein
MEGQEMTVDDVRTQLQRVFPAPWFIEWKAWEHDNGLKVVSVKARNAPYSFAAAEATETWDGMFKVLEALHVPIPGRPEPPPGHINWQKG